MRFNMSSPCPSSTDSVGSSLPASDPEVDTHASQIGNTNTKCALCNETFTIPKVLDCFHTFCQPCLEKVQVAADKITCPECHVVTPLGSHSVYGLMSDIAVSSILESYAVEANTNLSCTGCKSKETNAVARCFDCANFLCPNCVMAHQFMHCFEGHRVMTLGELQNGKGDLHMEKPVGCPRHKQDVLKYFCRSCNMPICKECTALDHPKGLHDFDHISEVEMNLVTAVTQLVDEGKMKTNELKMALKTVEHTGNRVQVIHVKRFRVKVCKLIFLELLLEGLSLFLLMMMLFS